MKQTAFSLIILFIAGLTFLCACSTQPSDESVSASSSVASLPASSTVDLPSSTINSAPSASESFPISSIISTPAQPTSPPTVTVKQIDADIFAATDSAHRYVDSAVDGTWYVQLTTDQPITQVKWLALDESEALRVERVLSTLGDFSADTVCSVQTYINDITANRGICFCQADGSTRFFAIRCSGQDGSLYLEEFSIAQ